jgi:predicted transcriptional regulator
MNRNNFEKKVLTRPGGVDRVGAMEKQLLVAQALGGLRRSMKVSQRELARRLDITQPGVAAIERSEDITISTLTR